MSHLASSWLLETASSQDDSFLSSFVFTWNLVPVHILPMIYHITAKWEWTAVWIIFCEVIIHRHKTVIKFPKHNNSVSSPIRFTRVPRSDRQPIMLFLTSFCLAILLGSLCNPAGRNHVCLELISHFVMLFIHINILLNWRQLRFYFNI